MCKIKYFKVRKQEHIHKTCNILFLTCFCLFVASTVVRIYFYNDLAVKNGDLRGTYESQIALEEEIASLKYEEAALSNMSYVEAEASKLGFIAMEERLMTLDASSTGVVASLTR